MNILSFRIKNYRSIDDTDWCRFSPDGITVLVGQNESGKTSILEALALVLNEEDISTDDKQVGIDILPSVGLKLRLSSKDMEANDREFNDEYYSAFAEFLDENDSTIEVTRRWKKAEGTNEKYIGYFELNADSLRQKFDEIEQNLRSKIESEAAKIEEEIGTKSPEQIAAAKAGHQIQLAKIRPPTLEALAVELIAKLPLAVLFQAKSGLLPDRIDIDETKGKLEGDGLVAAENFFDNIGAFRKTNY